MAVFRTCLAAILTTVLCIAPLAGRGLDQGGQVALDDVLSAYLGGDYEVVQRTFVRSIDFQQRVRVDRPRMLERWLGPWNRGKALLLLELARTSASIAPQYVVMFVNAGKRYFATAGDADRASDHTTEFVRLWRRTAVGLLQFAADPASVEEHVSDLQTEPRFLLARAIAQERRCWGSRPSIDQPAVRVEGLLEVAGVVVRDDTVGPSKSEREAIRAKHGVCLREALSRFEAAVRVEDAGAEALVRGAWVLLQEDRPKEALEWLDAAKPANDRDLEYWRGLFLGRAFEAIGRSQEAADAYRAALVVYPRAQSAGLGLALALRHLDHTQEADEVARSVREGGVMTPDPWEHYTFGDKRFVGRWIESLRTAVK